MATSNTKRARGPRKAIITPATLQRAQELLAEHRETKASLDRFVAQMGGQVRVPVQVFGETHLVLAHGFAQLLAKDLVALEGEAKRLGVALTEPAPKPLLPAVPQPPLAPPPGPMLGTAHPAAEAA